MKLLQMAVLAMVLFVGSNAHALTINVLATDTITAKLATGRPGGLPALSGDTLVIFGAHVENVHLANGLNNITFIGAKGNSWDGTTAGSGPGNPGNCLDGVGTNNGIVVQGINFQNGLTHIALTGNLCKVLYCTFRNASVGSIIISGDQSTVTGNVITNSGGGDSIGITGGGSASPNVTCTSNQIIGSTFNGINIASNNVVCTSNVVNLCGSQGGPNFGDIDVSGDSAKVMSNAVYSCQTNGIAVSGQSMTVTSNTVLYCQGGLKLSSSGNTMTVKSNNIQRIATDGITITDGTGNGGTIQGNFAYYCNGSGFIINGATPASTTLFLTSNATFNSQGFSIAGDFNSITSCTATSVWGAGFTITGAHNVMTSSGTNICAGNGIVVTTGTGNILNKVFAYTTTGQGLDNEAPGTMVTGSSFVANRINVSLSLAPLPVGTFAIYSGNNPVGVPAGPGTGATAWPVPQIP